MRLSTETEADQESAVEEATKAIRAGDLVVLPTDTVYGIAADAFEAASVQKLLDAKGRGRQMPPPVLISSPSTVDALATDVPEFARTLIAHFWPGALTLVCHQQPSLQWDLGETHGTVAVRLPMDSVALAILERTGPLAVSSANLSGQPAALDADAAFEMLGESVAVYVDAGPSQGGTASTIIDVTGESARILRLGALSVEQIKEALQLHAGLVIEGEGLEEPFTVPALETEPAAATDESADATEITEPEQGEPA
ncbi:L-threonylcarbamoyladenylate synthase [Nocardioides yefusunii]|uniref:L-threonylcarbamoyladenylate synthase n=1 Tax=Nocardioides yefusunii TaxID=2500546 RepID=A0ABW1QZ38_9ACTN|nr:L-threonylcarbamoyladenylate synthase [Nocardioides yefusunii]